MRKLVALGSFVLVGCLTLPAASLASGSQRPGVSAPADARLRASTEVDDAMLRQWASDVGVSLEVATQAFAASTAILDFQTLYADDSRFGGIWTSYEDGLRVHVRYLDASFERAVESLQDDLGRVGVPHPIELTLGGASYAELQEAVAALQAAAASADGASDLTPVYTLNTQLGTLDVSMASSLRDGLINPDLVRRVPPPPPSQGEREAGADLSIGCTVGYMWANGTQRGFVTAGHCSDAATTITPSGHASSAGVLVEHCASTGADFQVDTFTGTPDLGNWAYTKAAASPPWSTFSFGMAGGFYPTQPTWKVGYGPNATRSNGGQIIGYGSSTFASGDCPSGTVNGIQYTNLSMGGDSGGPVFVQYNGWELLATHVSGPIDEGPGARTGTGVATSSAHLPAGAFICTPTSGAC